MFEGGGAVADGGEVGSVGVDEGDVAEGAVAGDDDFGLEGGEGVEGREPVGEAGVGAGEGGHAAHGVVSGEEDAVGGDEDGGVTAGVVGAHGEDADGGAAEVEVVLLVEGDVGFTEGGAFEEFGVDGGAGGEGVGHLEAELGDVLLLVGGADHLGGGGEGVGAEVVLGMDVGGDEVESAAGCGFLGFGEDGAAVAVAHAGVDDESGAGADDDADVGDAGGGVGVGDDVDVGGDVVGVAGAD